MLNVLIDRDSGKWNLDEVETHRRRNLLWEIYVYDLWQVSRDQTNCVTWVHSSCSQSLTFGRPPSFALIHVDTKMPYEHIKNGTGDDPNSCTVLFISGFQNQLLMITQLPHGSMHGHLNA